MKPSETNTHLESENDGDVNVEDLDGDILCGAKAINCGAKAINCGAKAINDYMNEICGGGWSVRKVYHGVGCGNIPGGKLADKLLSSKRAIATRFVRIISGQAA
jgi:hypothetical protein